MLELGRGFSFVASQQRIKIGSEYYYLAHNHISNSAIPSMEDIDITREFVANVDGFLGHIVLGSSNRYSIIEEDYDNFKKNIYMK